jgi:RFX DNA-binding domain
MNYALFGGRLSKIESTVLYRAYETFCNEHGYKQLNDANFGKEVCRVFPSVERVKLCKKDIRMKGIKLCGEIPRVRPWGYQGLSLLPQEPTMTQWS